MALMGKITQGNYPQSSVVDSTLRLIHFPGVFVIGEGRYGQICVFIAFCYPISENTRKNLNNCGNSPRKLSTKSSRG